ncbi:MAG: NAD(P)-dependent oxidoreductase [Alphaproteobacteria bacterium]
MTVLVVGASGATGRLLVEQLLSRGVNVKVIVRSPDKLPETIKNHENLTLIRGGISELSAAEMVGHVAGCTAIASCLGHTLNLKGIYGQPRRLVTNAARRLCDAIRANNPSDPVKYVLMNTAGNSNRDLQEKTSIGQKLVIGLLRLVLPPQVDNEKAADYLRTEVGKGDAAIEWVAVRPDNLTDESDVTEYQAHPSPIRSAIFDAGLTSRINVGHFMAELITNDDTWRRWKGQMPVIYNKSA